MISERRDHAVLKMTYKIINRITPPYLNHIIPSQNQENITYCLRNRNDLVIPHANLRVVQLSFSHLAVKLWNKLPSETRNAATFTDLKQELKKLKKEKIILYYYGERWPSILHCRLRLGCSKLNFDVSRNLHIPDISPCCSCGALFENAYHFFMKCPNFQKQRQTLKTAIEQLITFDISTILLGSNALNLEENKLVFGSVQEYIMETGRFA